MSDQLSALDDDTIHWVNATSKNGVPFRIGTKKTEEGKSKRAVTENLETRVSGIEVDWEVQSTEKWIDTTEDVNNAVAIKQYSLFDAHGVIYQYELNFINTKPYKYLFDDKTGDSYEVNTFSVGEHTLSYNSSNPTIIYVGIS